MYSHKKPFTCRFSSLLVILLWPGNGDLCASGMADDYFNPALLDIDNPQQGKTDLSVYEKGPGQAPGKYQVTMFINNNKIDTRDVTFKLQKDDHGTARCSLALVWMI
jgi:outer membrane usher protein